MVGSAEKVRASELRGFRSMSLKGLGILLFAFGFGVVSSGWTNRTYWRRVALAFMAPSQSSSETLVKGCGIACVCRCFGG